MAYATLTDIQNRLGITLSTDEQTLVTDLLDFATELIDKYTGRTFTSVTTTEKFDGNDEETIIYLRHRPIISVTEVKLNGDTLTDDDDYYVYKTQGYIRFYNTTPDDEDPQNIEVTYTYGYSSVPSGIKYACIEMVVKAFDAYRASKQLSGAVRGSIGDFSIAFNPELMLTDEIKKMLDMYVQHHFVAV